MKNNLGNTFQFKAINGKLSVGSEYNRARFIERLKEGGQGHIIFKLPESPNQRRFFEGAVVPLATFFQEHLDYRNWRDCQVMREELAREFVGVDVVIVNGKEREIVRSTKGSKALNKILEDSIDWLVENYGIDQEQVLNPDRYKDWCERIHGCDPVLGEIDNYIDFLIAGDILKQKKNDNKKVGRRKSTKRLG